MNAHLRLSLPIAPPDPLAVDSPFPSTGANHSVANVDLLANRISITANHVAWRSTLAAPPMVTLGEVCSRSRSTC